MIFTQELNERCRQLFILLISQPTRKIFNKTSLIFEESQQSIPVPLTSNINTENSIAPSLSLLINPLTLMLIAKLTEIVYLFGSKYFVIKMYGIINY